MNCREVEQIEFSHPEVMSVQSDAWGLYYLLEKGNKNHLTLCGKEGKTVLTIQQARVLAVELAEILKVHF